MTAAPFVAGAWLAERLRARGNAGTDAVGTPGLDWRSPVAAFVGATLGLVVHPYSPLTLETFLTYVQIFRMGLVGAGQSGLELGNEIYRYPLPVLWDIYPLLLIVAAALPVAVAVRFRKLAPETVGLATAATSWFVLTVAAPRFVEYQVLLLALAIGFVVRDLVRPGPASAMGPEARLAAHPRWRVIAAGAALGALVGFHYRSMTFFDYYQSVAAPPRFYDGAGRWMEEHLAPGETVINLYWDDFPDLFYSAPRQHYLWGLDPTYSLRFDRERTLFLERSRRRLDGPIDGRKLRDQFGSRWLVLRASRISAYPELKLPPFTEVYRDGGGAVYRIDAVAGK
jgi:hypothetical protein